MSDFNNKSVDKLGREVNLPRIIAAGEHTMTSADEDIVIVGLAATDIVVVSVLSQDTTGVGVLIGTAEADNLNIASSEATTGDGVASYIVVRP